MNGAEENFDEQSSSSPVVPWFHKPLKDIVTPPGECIVLECRVGGQPEVIVWRREGAVIEDCMDFRMLHRGEVATLVIGEVFPEDAGVYSCVAINSAGSSDTSCSLTVQGGGGRYSIATHLSASKTSRLQGSCATPLTCDRVDDFKAEKDRLIKDVAKRVVSPVTMNQHVGAQDYVLYAPSATANEAETQDYKVSNFEQRLINEIEYRLEQSPPVIEDPEDDFYEDVDINQQISPSFTTPVKNFHVQVGNSITIKCNVTAKPNAKVFWFKDGKQISKRSRHYTMDGDGTTSFKLHIAHLCLDDDGNYTALAINTKGKICSSGRLAVTEQRSHQNIPQNGGFIRGFRVPEKGQLAADEECAVEKYYRPHFVQKPPDTVTCDEGKLVRFDVKLTGLPVPTVEWLINGQPVHPDSRHRILIRENNIHSLVFERASPMDEGRYTVVGSNKVGTVTADVLLKVMPREYATAPAFIQRLVARTAAEGEMIRLEARVLSTPRSVITWKKGSDQVMHNHHTQLYQDNSGYVCLQIVEARLSDAAWYTCSATNTAGIVSSTCKLDVYSPCQDNVGARQVRRIRKPHCYANLAKVAGVDMKQSLATDASQTSASSPIRDLPESEDL